MASQTAGDHSDKDLKSVTTPTHSYTPNACSCSPGLHLAIPLARLPICSRSTLEKRCQYESYGRWAWLTEPNTPKYSTHGCAERSRGWAWCGASSCAWRYTCTHEIIVTTHILATSLSSTQSNFSNHTTLRQTEIDRDLTSYETWLAAVEYFYSKRMWNSHNPPPTSRNILIFIS